MITTDNFKEIMNSFEPNEIDDEINKGGDFLCLELYVTNSGWSASIASTHYNEENEKEAQDSGNIYCDKDAFLQLCMDSDIIV